MKKWIVQYVVVLFCLLLSENAMAYWAKMSKEVLLKYPIIVYGQYIGTSPVNIDANSSLTNLGVIKTFEVLKGKQNQPLYFLKGHDPNLPISSDMLFFEPGQIGLWFLQPVENSTNLYQLNHPSQYQHLKEEISELERWKSLLK